MPNEPSPSTIWPLASLAGGGAANAVAATAEPAGGGAASPPASPAAGGPTVGEPASGFWPELWRWLPDLLPAWAKNLPKFQALRRVACWMGGAYLLVLMLPLLSVWSMALLRTLLPAAVAEPVHQALVQQIHQGYGIEHLARSLRAEAASDVLQQLNRSNESLDYVMYLELQLDRHNRRKALPIDLEQRQRAEIVIKRIAPQDRQEGSAGVGVTACDGLGRFLPTTAQVLAELGGMEVKRWPQMDQGDDPFRMHKSWWDQNLPKLRAAGLGEDNRISHLAFQLTDEFFGAIRDCEGTGLRVEAALRVFKRDVAGAPS